MTGSIVRLFCLCLLLLGATLPARATTAPRPQDVWDVPMKIVIVRSSEKGCEPTCPEWVMAEGRIDKDSPALLLSVYAKARQRSEGAKLPLIIRSPGGNILAALQMGYFLRAQGIDVAVGTTGYEGCSPFGKSCKPNADADGVYRGRVSGGRSFCLSACPLILAAGHRRLALPASILGVHHWGYDTPAGAKPPAKAAKAAKPEEESAEDKFVRRMIGDYLALLGNSAGLLDDMDKAPFSSIYLIKPKRRAALALVTQQDAPDLFTAASLCADEPAASCITAGITAAYRNSLLRVSVQESDTPMSATLVRDARTGCEPVCGEFIALTGAISPTTPKRVKRLLAEAGKRKLPVIIDSTGGDADAAIEIGRMIAKRGLDVAVAGVYYNGCPGDAGPCDSAKAKGVLRGRLAQSRHGCRGSCILILAAGKSRIVEPMGDIALYRPALLVSRAEPEKSAERIKAFLTAVKQEKLLARMSAQDSDFAIPLSGVESFSLALATATSAASAAFPQDACTQKPRPSWCVKR